jgi:hypothetical protein
MTGNVKPGIRSEEGWGDAPFLPSFYCSGPPDKLAEVLHAPVKSNDFHILDSSNRKGTQNNMVKTD